MDENNQIPPSTPTPVATPAPLTFKDRIGQDVKDLWNRDRLFLIIFGVLILLVKFRDILIDILVSSSKSVLKDAQKQDATLANQENDANKQADQLVQQAKDEPNKEKPVDDDWYKNTK